MISRKNDYNIFAFFFKDVTSIAKYAYNDLESGAEDLYNGFTEMQNFANILSSIESMNPEGGLASRMSGNLITNLETVLI